MPEIEVSSGRETILTSCIQVRFLWFADHWKHELVSSGKCAPIPRIWSVGAVPRPEIPKKIYSPFYQRLDAQVDPSGIAHASLGGQFGEHNFSATFTVEERPQEVVIEVEVVDHSSDSSDDLAATYLIEASDGELTPGDPLSIAWHHPECRLVFEADSPGKVTADEAGMGTIRLQASVPSDSSSTVHRLKYRWKWIHDPSHQIWDRDV